MKLYELVAHYIDASQEALAASEDEDGTGKGAERFALIAAGLSDEIAVKATNIAKMVLDLGDEQKVIKAEIDRLQGRLRTRKQTADWWKEYLLRQMQAADVDKLKSELFTISIHPNNPSCNVVDVSLVPAEYKYTPEPVVKAAEILKHLKETGEIPPGVEIQTGNVHLRIR